METGLDWLMRGLDRLGVRVGRNLLGKRELLRIRTDDWSDFLRCFAKGIQERSVILFEDPHNSEENSFEIDVRQFSELGDGPYFIFQTSGSSGVKKGCIHNLDTIYSAVKSYAEFFNHEKSLTGISLPLYHVGGFMALMRAFYLEHSVRFLSYRDLPNGNERMVVSLVPTQVKRLMDYGEGVDFLKGCEAVFIGGAASDMELIGRLKDEGIAAWLSYGSTETAAMVGVVSVADVGPQAPCYRPLPGVVMRESGGLLEVDSGSLLLGYCGDEMRREGFWKTADRGVVYEDGRFEVLGRSDRIIISGGKNLSLDRVEAVAGAISLVREVACVGVPHKEWGEQLALAYVGELDELALKVALSDQLGRWEIPKRILRLEELPRSGLGKVDRAQILRRLVEYRLQ